MGPSFVRALALSSTLVGLQACGGLLQQPTQTAQPLPQPTQSTPQPQPSQPPVEPTKIIVIGEQVTDGTGAVSSYEMNVVTGAMRKLDHATLPNLFGLIRVPGKRRVIAQVRTELQIPFVIASIDASGKIGAFTPVSEIDVPYDYRSNNPTSGVIDPSGRFFIVTDQNNEARVFDMAGDPPFPQVDRRPLAEPGESDGPYVDPVAVLSDGIGLVVHVSSYGPYGSDQYALLSVASDGTLGAPVWLSLPGPNVSLIETVAKDRLFIQNFTGDARFDAQLDSIESVSISATGTISSLAKCAATDCAAIHSAVAMPDASFAFGYVENDGRIYTTSLKPADGLKTFPNTRGQNGTLSIDGEASLVFEGVPTDGLLHTYRVQSSGSLEELPASPTWISKGFYWVIALGGS